MLLWAWCNSTKAASADGNDVRQFLEAGDLHGEDDVQVDQAGDSLYTGGLALLRWRRYPAQSGEVDVVVKGSRGAISDRYFEVVRIAVGFRYLLLFHC